MPKGGGYRRYGRAKSRKGMRYKRRYKKRYSGKKLAVARRARFYNLYAGSAPVFSGRLNAVVADSCVRTLRYVEIRNFGGGIAGTAVWHGYRANGCFDPQVTAGGHQPFGFDQMMTLYYTFKVVSAKITVTFVQNTGGGYEQDLQYGIIGSANYGLPAVGGGADQITACCESPEANWVAGTQSPYQQQTAVTKTFNVYRDLPASSRGPTVAGNAAADPTTQWYFNIFRGSSGHAYEAANATITIDYRVVFSEPSQLAAS